MSDFDFDLSKVTQGQIQCGLTLHNDFLLVSLVIRSKCYSQLTLIGPTLCPLGSTILREDTLSPNGTMIKFMCSPSKFFKLKISYVDHDGKPEGNVSLE